MNLSFIYYSLPVTGNGLAGNAIRKRPHGGDAPSDATVRATEWNIAIHIAVQKR